MAVNERVAVGDQGAKDRQIETIRSLWLKLLGRYPAIAIIRAQTVKTGVSMAKAAAAGGFCLIEVAWNHNADPAEMMAEIRAAVPDCVVGVGTILSEADLLESIAAQAQFCFTPHTDGGLIDLARSHQIPMIAGAMTPTEIVTAWQAGAASVKVFPISSLGNGAYIRSILGPLKSIPLVPTGGVSCESAPELIKAGAVAVGLSTALFPPDEVAKADWVAIEARSRYLLTLLAAI
ncbi:MAG: ketohydroxyglutarate aldolase [Phormidesmis priestleyi]|uniref:Ketohydroxyglutarate aldolase n=1 Tax=Phormidesmis priestleyi TaxID=268141 RepID=A0A2W4WGH1_9CYAN|nr:MAG: ketohydroxyglutarate aldolase [Phormidesmis priestleyi]